MADGADVVQHKQFGDQRIIGDENIVPDPSQEEIERHGRDLGMLLPEDEKYLYIAEQCLKTPLPEPWKSCEDVKSGEQYYFNFKTGESVWEHPVDVEFRNKYIQQKADDTGRTFEDVEDEVMARLDELEEGDEQDEDIPEEIDDGGEDFEEPDISSRSFDRDDIDLGGSLDAGGVGAKSLFKGIDDLQAELGDLGSDKEQPKAVGTMGQVSDEEDDSATPSLSGDETDQGLTKVASSGTANQVRPTTAAPQQGKSQAQVKGEYLAELDEALSKWKAEEQQRHEAEKAKITESLDAELKQFKKDLSDKLKKDKASEEEKLRAEIKSTTDTLEKEKAKLQAHLDSAKAEHNEDMKALKADQDKARSVIQTEHDQAVAGLKAAHDAQMRQLKTEHEDAMAKLEKEHGEQLKQAQKDHQEELSKLKKDHEAEIIRAKDSLETSLAHINKDKAATLRKEEEEAQQELKAAEEALKDAKAKLESTKNELEAAKKDGEAAKAQLDNLASEKLSEQKKKVQDQINALSKEAEQLEGQVASLDETLKTMEHDRDELEAEMAKMKQDQETARQRHEKALAVIMDRKVELEQRVADLGKTMSQNEARINAQATELEEIKAEKARATSSRDHAGTSTGSQQDSLTAEERQLVDTLRRNKAAVEKLKSQLEQELRQEEKQLVQLHEQAVKQVREEYRQQLEALAEQSPAANGAGQAEQTPWRHSERPGLRLGDLDPMTPGLARNATPHRGGQDETKDVRQLQRHLRDALAEHDAGHAAQEDHHLQQLRNERESMRRELESEELNQASSNDILRKVKKFIELDDKLARSSSVGRPFSDSQGRAAAVAAGGVDADAEDEDDEEEDEASVADQAVLTQVRSYLNSVGARLATDADGISRSTRSRLPPSRLLPRTRVEALPPRRERATFSSAPINNDILENHNRWMASFRQDLAASRARFGLSHQSTPRHAATWTSTGRAYGVHNSSSMAVRPTVPMRLGLDSSGHVKVYNRPYVMHDTR